LIADDLIIIGTDGRGIGHVYAFERSTGNIRWKHAVTSGVPDGIGFPTDIVRTNSTIYTVAFGDELVCLDIKTGKIKWSYKSDFAGKEFIWSHAPSAEGSKIFFGGIDGVVYALDSETGRLIWKYNVGARISAHPVARNGELFVGAANGHIYRLNQKNGSVDADFALKSMPVGRFTFVNDSLFLFINSLGGDGGAQELVCLDQALTKVRWSQPAPKSWSLTTAKVWRSNVLTGTESGEVIAFRLTDGAMQWTEKLNGVIRSIGSSDKALYIGTLDGTLYASSHD